MILIKNSPFLQSNKSNSQIIKMKKIFILLFVCLFINKSFAYGETGEAELNAPTKAYILSRFCTEVKYNFAFYDKLNFNWDSLCVASMPSLTATSSDEDFLKGMQPLCNQLHDGHTYIFPMNNPKNQADWIRPFPMKTKRIGDRVFVTDVYSSNLQQSGVHPGCEIIEIDGENVLDYGNKHIRPYLASSTPQWAKYRPFAEFELTKDKGSKSSKILFKNKKGKEFTVESNRNLSWDLKKDTPSMSFKVKEDNIGLLTVGSFQNSDFNRTYFDELYDEILKTDALIIDIRNNSGGNSSHADYLISHFIRLPIPQETWSSPMYIAAHASWNYPREWYMQTPAPVLPMDEKEIYQKPIILLVNATTFSSAENFCVLFKGAKRGKIIGTPTGGSTGNPIFIDLGFGLGCCICTKHELDTDGNEFIGIGIQPDIVAEEDINTFLNNGDSVIEKALDFLRSK